VTLSSTDRREQLDADEAVLMSLAFHGDSGELAEALRLVRPPDFVSPPRELIWRVIETYAANGSVLDVASLHSALSAAVTGVQLRRCMEVVTRECVSAPMTGWAPLAAQRVAKAARLRRVGAMGQRLAQLADMGDVDSFDDVMAQVAQTWREVEDHATAGNTAPRVTEFVDAYMGELAAGPVHDVIPTPWTEINAIFNGGGLRPGGMYVIGARPGVGKTLAGGGLAWTAAESGYGTLMVSAEMHRHELMDRWMARSLREELSEFTSFNPSDRVLQAATGYAQWVKDNDIPLWVLDQSSITMDAIMREARQLQRRHGLALIVIDYLQLLTAAGGRNRQEQVSQMSAACKRMAKELHVPVVVLAQLNRGAAGDVPAMSHFRETGAIEQDADGVILLHLPVVIEENPDGSKREIHQGIIQFIVAKNRHGRTGTVDLSYRAYQGDITDRT
jgi:replicative DNA helicase